MVVAGSIQANDLGQASNIWLRKLSPGGDELWTRTHNGKADLGESVRGVAIDTNDNIVVAGTVRDTPVAEFWMRKYAP